MLYSRLFLLSGANIKLFIEYPLKKRLNICEYDIFFIPLHPLSRTKVKWTAGQLSWLERRIHNPEVRGSQPRPATKRLIIIMITNLFLFSIQPNARLNMSLSRQERFYYKAILNFIVHTHILQEYIYFIFLSLLTLHLFLCKLTS